MKRSLSREEAVLWARLAGTVKPIDSAKKLNRDHLQSLAAALAIPKRKAAAAVSTPLVSVAQSAEKRPIVSAKEGNISGRTLDANWDRKLARGVVQPDFTIDLHGHTLDQAHSRLEHGLTLAAAQGARLVLLITGRPRPGDAAGRGERRGAIRAKFLDWLALGSHSGRIAAIRPAHPRHGGSGAVYLVLRKGR